MCGFSLVPILTVPFYKYTQSHLSDATNQSNPFYHPVTINLNINREIIQGIIYHDYHNRISE